MNNDYTPRVKPFYSDYDLDVMARELWILGCELDRINPDDPEYHVERKRLTRLLVYKFEAYRIACGYGDCELR